MWKRNKSSSSTTKISASLLLFTILFLVVAIALAGTTTFLLCSAAPVNNNNNKKSTRIDDVIISSSRSNSFQNDRRSAAAVSLAAAANNNGDSIVTPPKFEAGSSHLNIEGIQRGISVESIRKGSHLLTLQLVGGSARFSRSLSNSDRLNFLQKLFNSVPQLPRVDFGAGTWDTYKHHIFGEDHGATTSVSASGRTMKIVLGSAPDFDLEIPERVLITTTPLETKKPQMFPTELFTRGSSISAISNKDFIIFPDGRLDIVVIDTGTPMVSHPVMLDIGLAHNANTSYPLKLMRGRDCRANSFLMDVAWPSNNNNNNNFSPSSSKTSPPPAAASDESTVVEFVPTSGSEQVTVCYVPQGEDVQSISLNQEPIYIAASFGGDGVSHSSAGKKSSQSKGLSISGPTFAGTRSLAVGETITTQILGFNLTYDDVVAVAPTGQCDALDVLTALQLPFYLASSSLAEAQVQVQEVGVYDLCYYRDGAAAFIPVSTIAVTHTDGTHKTADVNVSKGVHVDLTGNIYSANFRVLDGGVVRLNSHQVNTTHFEWRDGTIEGWGGINCQMGVDPHVIDSAASASSPLKVSTGGPGGSSTITNRREISVQIQNFGVMYLHVDHLHFTGQGMIYNHRHLIVVAESPRALINTADHLARRIVNGVRGHIDFVIGSAPSVQDVIHPVLISTALIENLGTITVSPHMQVKLRRLTNLPTGVVQLQLGSTALIEGGQIEGSFDLDTDTVMGFAGDIALIGTTFSTVDKSHLLFNAVQYIKLSSVTVNGAGHVVIHSQPTTTSSSSQQQQQQQQQPRASKYSGKNGIVALEGTTTFAKQTLVAIKNVSLAAERNIAYLNIHGRLICHVPSVVLGDNIVMSAALNSVLFGSGAESARVVPQRVPPNNSAFVLPQNASLILVDVDGGLKQDQQQQNGGGVNLEQNPPASAAVARGATTQVCSQYLVVPIHVILSGHVQLLGCVMLPLGSKTSGSIYGASAADVIEQTSKFAFCKNALTGEASGKLGTTSSSSSSSSSSSAAKKQTASDAAAASNNNKNSNKKSDAEILIEKIVKVPGDVCISLGSGDDEYYSLLEEFSNNKGGMKNTDGVMTDGVATSSALIRNSNLALGGTHVFTEENGNTKQNADGTKKPHVDVDKMEVLPQAVLEATAVVKLLANRGIIVRPEAVIALSLGGIIGSTIMTLEGTLVVDSQFPLLINGTLQGESNAALVVRAYDTFISSGKNSESTSSKNTRELAPYTGISAGNGKDGDNSNICTYPLYIAGGCSFLDTSVISIDGRPPRDQSSSIALIRADLGIIGSPLIKWMDENYANETLAVAIRRAKTLSTTGRPVVELPTPYRKKLAVCLIIIVACVASLYFYARIGRKFLDELFAEPDYPMWLGIAEFWNSFMDWFAVAAILLEIFFLCAPAFHQHLHIPPFMHTIRSFLTWMVTANHDDGSWEGPLKYYSLFVLDFVFVVMWVWLYFSRANPEAQRAASPRTQQLYSLAQQACTWMTFVGLTLFIPITATLMEPISCKFLFMGAYDCHHAEQYLILGTFSLVCFLVLAPLSGTSLRTPFSHPPFMRDLDIRYKRTYIHLHCVLLGAMISCWKIFSRNAFQLQLAHLVILTLMFLLYRYSHPCIYENINTLRQSLFIIPFFASMAALIQLVRFDGVPSALCDQPIEYGFVGVFFAGIIIAFGLIGLTLYKGSTGEGMPSFNPQATQARNAVLYRFSEVERIQLKMYNASTASERARLAEDLADKRVEYQQALQQLRKRLAPLQMRFYLGDEATSLVLDNFVDNIVSDNNNHNNHHRHHHRGGGGGDDGESSHFINHRGNASNVMMNNMFGNDNDDDPEYGEELQNRQHNDNNRQNQTDRVIQVIKNKLEQDELNNNNGNGAGASSPSAAAASSSGFSGMSVATADELRELTPEQMSNYTEGPILGRGTYGTVYMAMLSIGKLVAVKVVPIIKKQKAESLNSIKREVDVLRTMSHPNVIRCYGCSYPPKKDSICIFMELATSGSLTQIVRRFGGLGENVVQVYTKQILKGLQYLHSRNAVHRDIKGENVLVDGSGVAKLGDFGCSKFLADVANKSRAGCASLVGSPFWMAPEVIRNEAYGTKADIWSLGCTVVEMLNGGHPPWSETFDNVYSAMYFISNSNSIPTNVPDGITELCKDFLSRCFDRDVSKRASATELLNHPWLSEDNIGSPLTPDQLHTAIQHGAHLSTSQVHSTATSTMGTPSTTNNNNNMMMMGGRHGGKRADRRRQQQTQFSSGDENNEEYDDYDDDNENNEEYNDDNDDGSSVPQNVVVGGNGGHSPRGRANNTNIPSRHGGGGGGWSGLFEGLNSSGPAPSSHMTGDSNSFQPSELSGGGGDTDGSQCGGSTF